MKERIEKLSKALEDHSIDAYYCRKTSDIRWLTNFLGVFDTEAAHLALCIGGDMVLHTDSRYSEAMRQNPARGNLEINDDRVSHMDFAAARIADSDLKPIDGHKLRIGVESNIPLNEYRALVKSLEAKGLDFVIVEMKDPILKLREVKDESEIELMRKAQKITDETFSDLLGWVKPGMTEMQVANEMEYKMRSLGASGLAFETIVASGYHSAMPHAVASEKKLENGDFVILDFGAKYGDYCSDMTRTIAIGEPSDELKKIYKTVLKAQTECEAAVAVGKDYSEIHELAEKIIAEGGYPNLMGHSLGHSVGIDIHESPTFGPRSVGQIAAGNVITVEPGIYVPGVGGVRIEDYGVITGDGYRPFTQSVHELQII